MHAINAEIRRDFGQDSYAQRSEVVLLEVDPEWVHIYWHIREQDLALVRNPSQPIILRLHDLSYFDISGANPHATREIRLHDLRARQYLHVPGGNKSLLAQIGMLTPYRHLQILAQSRAVRLPRCTLKACHAPRAFPQTVVPLSREQDRALLPRPSERVDLFPLSSGAFLQRSDNLLWPAMEDSA